MSMINLGGSTQSVTKALREYRAAWKSFLVVHHLEALDRAARPATLSWKVADKDAVYANLSLLGDKIEQMHLATVNGRFIASAVLRQPDDGFHIIKIMERRAGSDDPLGLDSIDFVVGDKPGTFRLLEDAGAHVEKQHNDLYDWLSLRFGKGLEYEAKFNDSLVLKVSVHELELANSHIRDAITPELG